MTTRPAAVAGRFYPGDPSALSRQVGAFLADADRAAATPAALLPKAVIAPHAGYMFSGRVAASAYARLAGAKGAVKRVVVAGPSHFAGFQGLAGSAAEAWLTPLGAVRIARPASGVAVSAELDGALAPEYSVEVHIPFLQSLLGEFELVPVTVGHARPEAVAALLDALWGGPETLIVISSDLSHFLDYHAAQVSDSRTAALIEQFEAGALLPAHACGCVPVGGLLLSARRRGMTAATLDLANSADVGGPRDRVVGYGAWALYERQTQGEPVADAAVLSAAGPILIELARASIMHGFATGEPLAPSNAHGLPAIVHKPGASFVTLRRQGRLRGCIGTFVAVRALMADVAMNAFGAAFRDHRFAPLRPDEMEGLDLSIAVLTRPAALAFESEEDLLRQLEPGLDGLIIEDQGKRALFLPVVWSEARDKRQFLAQLRLKAGLAADHWSAEFKAFGFRTVETKSPARRG